MCVIANTAAVQNEQPLFLFNFKEGVYEFLFNFIVCGQNRVPTKHERTMPMDKPLKELTGYIPFPLCVGERASIVNGERVTLTSLVVAIHEESKKRVVIETMNTVYSVESTKPDVIFPANKRRKWLFNIFAKLRKNKKLLTMPQQIFTATK